MKKISIFLLGATVVGLTSCLKDKQVNLAPGASPAVVEWSTAVVALTPGSVVASSPAMVFPLAYETSPAVKQNLEVGYTGGSNAPSDITVNIGVDYAKLAAFNVANFGDSTVAANKANYYVGLPASLFTLSKSVVIKSGTAKATVTLTLNTAGFDFSKKYAIPATITSVSGTSAAISGNYGMIVLAPVAKNKWDGVYTLAGTTVSPDRTNVYTAGPWTWPGNVNLVTATATSVNFYDATYNWGGGESQRVFALGATATTGIGFGSTYSRYTFDEATNKVTAVTNVFVNPANGRALAIDPSYDSKYDPAAKTISMRFFFTQPGFQTTTVTYNLKYVKSR